jgi:hypothetical protein
MGSGEVRVAPTCHKPYAAIHFLPARLGCSQPSILGKVTVDAQPLEACRLPD